MTAASKVVVDPDDPRSLIARHLTPDPAATLLTRHPTRCRGPPAHSPVGTACEWLHTQPETGEPHDLFLWSTSPQKPILLYALASLLSNGKEALSIRRPSGPHSTPRVHALMNNDTSRSIPRFMCRIFWVRGEGGKENIPHSQLARPNVAAAVPAVRPARRPPSFTAAEARQGVPASAPSARSLVTT